MKKLETESLKLGRALRNSLGNETVVGRGVNGAVHGGDGKEFGGCSLDERDKRTGRGDELDVLDRRKRAHVVEPDSANTQAAAI